MNTIQLSDLTLDQKIGQLFVCGFHTNVPNEHITELIEKYHVGGVIYFRRNIGTARQITDLSTGLQQIAQRQGLPPLLIAIDQEGGMVSRIDQDGMSLIPGNMTLGAVNDVALTAAASAISARELRTLGINLNFAPCVDVNNNPRNPVIGVRSYSEKPEVVAIHGAAAIQAIQQEYVAATAKHFPGHGDTEVDSHYGLASVPHDQLRLEQIELLPFRSAIDVGVDVIMSAHVIFPAFEPEPIPATLSRKVLTDLLRIEMGFEGLIVTDCLEMHAIAKHFPIPQATVMAAQAGADLLLVSHTLEHQIAAIEAVKEAVQQGQLSEAQIDASVERILSLKAKHQMDAAPYTIEEWTQRLEPEPIEPVLREIAERSITLVKDEGQLPLQPDDKVLIIWPQVTRLTEVDEPTGHDVSFAQALNSYGIDATQITIDARPEPEEIQQVLAEAIHYPKVIFAAYTSSGLLPLGQAELARQLSLLTDTALIVASVRNPYDLNDLPEIKTYICSYENRKYAVEALAAVIAGVKPALGKLPVSLNEQYQVQI